MQAQRTVAVISDPLASLRHRKKVLFLSYCRFWDKHPFVQQSLARTLLDHGIAVHWLDGRGVGNYQPTLYWSHPQLKVQELFRFPGERFDWVKKANAALSTRLLRPLFENENPLVWVQGGFESEILKHLPYIDVYSVFDDPYRHDPLDPLCARAKVIVCQNTNAWKIFSKYYPEKTVRLLPPTQVAQTEAQTESLDLPMSFPARRMGYIGSCYYDGFDFELFETFVQAMPSWGFVLQGRTDSAGKKAIDRLSKYSNFHYREWVEPSRLASTWRALHVTLLLYRELSSQAGAFPIKVLESLYYGVPCVATDVLKTQDLFDIPKHSSPEVLLKLAQEAVQMPSTRIVQLYKRYKAEMNPLNHLKVVAEKLSHSGADSISSATGKLKVPVFAS